MICVLYFVHVAYSVYFVCVFFFKGDRKSLSEPGVSCSESMSSVLHYTVSLFLNK